jgi:hypothetical protein
LRFVAIHVFAKEDGAEPVEIAHVWEGRSPHVFRDRSAGRLGLEITFRCDDRGRTPILAIGKDVSWASGEGEALW